MLFVDDGSTDGTRARLRDPSRARRAGAADRFHAQLRQGGGAGGRHRPRSRRRGRADRCRSAGSTGTHSADDRTVARGLRRRLRRARGPRERYLAQKRASAGLFYRWFNRIGEQSDPRRYRRLPSDRQAGGGGAAAVARTQSLYEGPVCLGWIPQHRRAVPARNAVGRGESVCLLAAVGAGARRHHRFLDAAAAGYGRSSACSSPSLRCSTVASSSCAP